MASVSCIPLLFFFFSIFFSFLPRSLSSFVMLDFGRMRLAAVARGGSVMRGAAGGGSQRLVRGGHAARVQRTCGWSPGGAVRGRVRQWRAGTPCGARLAAAPGNAVRGARAGLGRRFVGTPCVARAAVVLHGLQGAAGCRWCDAVQWRHVASRLSPIHAWI